MCMNRGVVPRIVCMAAVTGESFMRSATDLRQASIVPASPSGLRR